MCIRAGIMKNTTPRSVYHPSADWPVVRCSPEAVSSLTRLVAEGKPLKLDDNLDPTLSRMEACCGHCIKGE